MSMMDELAIQTPLSANVAPVIAKQCAKQYPKQYPKQYFIYAYNIHYYFERVQQGYIMEPQRLAKKYQSHSDTAKYYVYYDTYDSICVLIWKKPIRENTIMHKLYDMSHAYDKPASIKGCNSSIKRHDTGFNFDEDEINHYVMGVLLSRISRSLNTGVTYYYRSKTMLPNYSHELIPRLSWERSCTLPLCNITSIYINFRPDCCSEIRPYDHLYRMPPSPGIDVATQDRIRELKNGLQKIGYYGI